MAFPENVHQVEVIKIGNARVITPAGERWKDFFENGPHVSEDFMVERTQPPLEKREEF
jgi:antitoxin VapB